MSERQQFVRKARWQDAARRSLEYGIAIGIAVLCGYGIVLWHW
ncbi:MAG: hypothetical protein WA369_00205 [Candidatus Acidiferrales bacterium]|jgi:hypothetical protein